MYDSDMMEEMVKAAGKIALTHFGNVKPAWKDNQTYVTEGDLAVQDYLKRELERRFPDDGIVAEERNLSKKPRSGDRYWIIDPIDGTASFVQGFPVWGISVGLMAGSEPAGGFFFIPVTGEYFCTTTDGKVLKNGVPVHLREFEPCSRETVLLADGKLHKWLHVRPDYSGKVRSLGSSVAHLSYLASGSADAVMLANAHIWDLAAGYAMLKINGGIMEYFDGAPVTLAALLHETQAPDVILAGQPERVEQFRTFLSRWI